MLWQFDNMLFNRRMPVNFVEFIIESVRLLCQFEIDFHCLLLFWVVLINSIVFDYFQYLPITWVAMVELR